MKRYPNTKWSKALVAFGIAMSCAWAVSSVLSLKDQIEVAKMTKQMKTHCVGRFLIDLPENATVAMRGAFIHGFDISTFPNETDQAFSERVAKKEAEINATPNEFGTKNMEMARTINRAGMVGKIFVFAREAIPGHNVTYTNVEMAGYVHMNGISFSFTSHFKDLGQDRNMEKLINQLRPLAENEIPTEPGFCVNRGIILDPLTADQGERVTLFARLPGHPDISIDFDTLAGTEPGPGLLARDAKDNTVKHEHPLNFHTLRSHARVINGIPGEELVEKVREENFTTGYDFGWESIGKKDDVFLPELTLDLDAGHGPRPGSGPVQSSLSETAIVALWDAISSSVRLRPTTPPKVSVAPAPIPPRGTYAEANTACPQGGWWRCLDGAPNIEISGGQTQYFRKGDLIPQATVLISPTLLQRVRGEEPSFQSEIATTWKLVDYRSRPRTAPALPLAQATAARNGDSVPNIKAADNNKEHAMTPVGQFVETDTPCPESGWWRCPEPDAVDGTRWFAQGGVLPPATCHSPRSWADKLKGTPGLIRYRSVWQFVRHDAGPASAPSSAADEIDSAG